MAKKNVKYSCSNCGYISPMSLGKCPHCQEWNTFIETLDEKEDIKTKNALTTIYNHNSKAKLLNDINTENDIRMSTGYKECDRVLGGGIVLGSLILLSGDPGIGKSTLLLQIIGNISKQSTVMYVSGEESEQQVKLRADRLNIKSNNLYILGETHISSIIQQIEEIKPKLVIIDSIQTMMDTSIANSSGSVSQIRQCTSLLMQLANKTGISIIIVGHVTKDGEIAGPKHLEHMVDTVLFFEGDKQHQIRILRTEKNRFGSTDEIGIFEMANIGLIEVKNPSELFLSDNNESNIGSSITVTLEGTRPILVEIQALVVPTQFGYPRRMAIGIDDNKVILLSAILEKKIGIPLGKHDIYVNVVGGMKIKETASDLAICMAIISSFKDISLPNKTVFIGEVGLTGEIRNVPQCSQRINEANKLGWTNNVIPKQKTDTPSNKQFNHIKEIIKEIFPYKK